MSASLLATKFYIPPARPEAVARPQLVGRLLTSAARPASFTLLSGPAGFGKTTLLSEFAARLSRPPAWVSLDEGDNDPARFWRYLVTACQAVQEGVGAAALALCQSPQPLPVEAVPTSLINDLAGPGSEMVLVLDDFHLIHNQAVLAASAFLLENQPARLHIVLSTRSDPPWPLGRWRAGGRLVEIRAADLRFTPAETAAFLNQGMGLGLPEEAVAALAARTEGWIAGLQLAALSMQGRSDSAAFIQAFTGSHVYVAEYLLEEVLNRQDEGVQAFLLQTALLERLEAGLCQAVTGRPDSQAVLAGLQRANLFVLPLDDDGRWFRYHHLFADLLQARLRQARSPQEIAGLHGRASAWFEQHGLAVEAVDHALAARDFEAAARLVDQNAYQMIIRGELGTLIQWLEALPGEVLRSHPTSMIAKAWTLTLAGAAWQVEPLLQQVEAQIESAPTPVGDELLGNVAAIRAFFAMLAADYERALRLAEQAEALLPEGSVQARSILPYTLGAAYRGRGQYEQAAEAFARQARLGEAHHDLLVWATGITEIINVRRMQGRLNQAGETGRQALVRLAGQGALPFGSLAKIEVALCEVLREKNELEEARRRLGGVIGRMQTWDMPTDRLFARLTLIRVQQAQGDLAAAFENLQAAKELRASYPVLAALARAVDFCEVRLALAVHDLPTAARLAEGFQAAAGQTVMVHEQELPMLARVRMAQGRAGEAAAILSPLACQAGAGGRIFTLIESLVLLACAREAQGERAAALETLNQALALAGPEGYVRVFVDEGAPLHQLLLAAERRLAAGGPPAAPLRAYAAQLIAAFPASPAPGGPHPAGDEADGPVKPLTPRELAVLQLIAAGCSNQTIADTLVITLSAVKKHTTNIFAKLNVDSRTQAVARARRLGWLPPGE